VRPYKVDTGWDIEGKPPDPGTWNPMQ
jgi:hypothetical protein